MNSTSLKGDLERAGGVVQSSIGEAIGDRDLQAEGASNEAAGMVNQIAGQAREAVEVAIDGGTRLLEEGRRRIPDGVRNIDGVSLGVIAAATTLGFFAAWLVFRAAPTERR
jgi:uncharacterized protein YjbJ (UPF0337 family)